MQISAHFQIPSGDIREFLRHSLDSECVLPQDLVQSPEPRVGPGFLAGLGAEPLDIGALRGGCEEEQAEE